MTETGTKTVEPETLVLPDGTLDVMLAAAARSVPGRVAVHTRDTATTFAAVDAHASACAAVLQRLLDRPGSVVALSALLDPAFVGNYYGIARSGHVIATLNPLLPAPGLAHALRTSGARIALVGVQDHERLREVWSTLPDIEHVFVFGPGADAVDEAAASSADGPRVRGWDAVLDAARAEGATPQPTSRGDEDVAVIAYTSGTTGPPKGVLHSHRNVKACAAQVDRAHHLDSTSTILTYLPVYAPMHMNAAVNAGASQVLCGSRDIEHAVAAANRHGVTHFYTLPLVLGWFVDHPRFPDLGFETLSMIASGAAPLVPRLVSALSGALGIPVFQGYGMCETAYLAFSDGPVDPRPGSVGLPLAGSECRLVDLETRLQVGVGEIGEVQLRGPNLMKGYLDPPAAPTFDADGYFSTGDVGYRDSDGYLFLLDRAKDVFRSAGQLVSPSQIELVLAEHPAVRDCVVVDATDPTGAVVPAALVVLAVDDDADDSLARIRGFVDARVQPHQRLGELTTVDRVPRSPTNGKVLRTEARNLLRARTTAG